MMRRFFFLLIACAMTTFWIDTARAQSSDEAEWLPQPIALLAGLDKVTARISTIIAPIGQEVRFGALQIRVDTCQKRPPTLPPENAAFLVIDDIRPDEPPKRVFNGWMFASSPALHALEHPVYDISVLECKSAETQGQSSTSG